MEGDAGGRMNLQAFRDRHKFQQLYREVEPLLYRVREKAGRKLRLMEVCGTHSAAFSKSGVRDLLSPFVELISGPGCPVCVTDQSDIDQMIAFASNREVIVATFGDMMKVPGSHATLEREKSGGADVRIVTSASQAVALAKRNPSYKVVFLGVGFETTAPGAALSLQQARQEGLRNYFVYSAHKLTPPALMTLIKDVTHQLDGFVIPGHVSVIIGRQGWTFLEESDVPAVIGGFEPIDLLMSVAVLLKEMENPLHRVINLYPRVVKEEGNPKAQQIVSDCFEVSTMTWRGFGQIEQSGLSLNKAYGDYEAMKHVEVTHRPRTKVIQGCRCGEIVKGKESPLDCKLFGKACTPLQPLGPCMVSSEGTCATFFHYKSATVMGG
jgi:hydrogenase expression/formation protein HypD